jgi:hypothetical protein
MSCTLIHRVSFVSKLSVLVSRLLRLFPAMKQFLEYCWIKNDDDILLAGK